MDHDFNLNRFVEAQEPMYSAVTAELADGCKVSHWMWFIFPQIAGLGFSAMSRRYAISGLDEARRYLRHPLLGPRLRECTRLVNQLDGRTAKEIFGSIDSTKFRSSLTLFARASPDDPIFQAALDKYFDGDEDPLTVERVLT